MSQPFIVGITPFELPDPKLAVAICAAGGLGVVDIGSDPAAARAAIDEVARRVTRFGVRVPEGAPPVALPASVEVVIVSSADDVAAFRPRRVWVQVTSLAEARAAVAAGADALIAKGTESGGRVGDETTFVLLQRLVGRASRRADLGAGRHRSPHRGGVPWSAAPPASSSTRSSRSSRNRRSPPR